MKTEISRIRYETGNRKKLGTKETGGVEEGLGGLLICTRESENVVSKES